MKTEERAEGGTWEMFFSGSLLTIYAIYISLAFFELLVNICQIANSLSDSNRALDCEPCVFDSFP